MDSGAFFSLVFFLGGIAGWLIKPAVPVAGETRPCVCQCSCAAPALTAESNFSGYFVIGIALFLGLVVNAFLAYGVEFRRTVSGQQVQVSLKGKSGKGVYGADRGLRITD